MGLALAEVYEVATFYAHFEVVKEDASPPPAVTIRVCESLSCAMAGAEQLIEQLSKSCPPDVRVLRAPCMGACDRAPVAAVGHEQVPQASADKVMAGAKAAPPAAAPPPPDSEARYFAPS